MEYVLLVQERDTGQWVEWQRSDYSRSGKAILESVARSLFANTRIDISLERAERAASALAKIPTKKSNAIFNKLIQRRKRYGMQCTYFNQFNLFLYAGMKNSGWAVWTVIGTTPQKTYFCSDREGAMQMYKDLANTIKTTGVVTL